MRKFPAFLLLCGAVLFGELYFPALSGWFIREDSRFFSSGLPSAYDLLSVFLTPQNSMGQYRPVTKLFWTLPTWLGLFSPLTYHLFSQLLLALSALFLMRLCWRLFGNPLLAVAAGIFWAMMPVHALSIYWASAYQSLAAELFILAMLVFRIEQWKRPDRARGYRILSLACLALALCSREVAFAAAPLLLLIDFHFGRLRRGWDVLAVLVPFVIFVFVVQPPFARARVEVSLSPLFLARGLWDFALSVPWTTGHAKLAHYPLWNQLLSASILVAGMLGSYWRRELLFAGLLALAGVLPFLLIGVDAVEYGFLFGAGLALLCFGALSLLLDKLHWPAREAPVFAILLVLFGGYSWFLRDHREIFGEVFVSHSKLLENFFTDLRAFTRTVPADRPILITDLGPYGESPARDTHHFIPGGLDQLLPDRIVLIAPETLKANEETMKHNPHSPIWNQTYSRVAPLKIHYTAKGFALD